MMQLIGKDDKRTTVKRQLKDSSTISCDFTVKMSKDDDAPRYFLEGVMFDFKGFGMANIQKLACRPLIIMVQQMARDALTREGIQALERVFNVEAMLDTTRTPKTDLEKARLAFTKLSPEDRQEMANALLDEMGALEAS